MFKIFESVKTRASVYLNSFNTQKMVKRTSQGRVKVILRDLGFIWQKIRKMGFTNKSTGQKFFKT